MKILCIGAGPAGLSFAIRLKRKRPDHDVVLVERGAPREAEGWGLILSDGVIAGLEADDPVSGRAIREKTIAWGDISVEVDGTATTVRGHEFLALARVDLIAILRERAEALGVEIRYDTIVDPDDDSCERADLVVAADGSRSRIRDADRPGFGVEIREGANRYIWLGIPQKIASSFRFIFETTAAGPIWAHSYPFADDFTTFVVECSGATHHALGFNAMETDAALAVLRRIFASSLCGAPLFVGDARRSAARWSRFAEVRCASWLSGRTVLLGNAAHGTHFSIGSGTRLAIGDGRELARQVAAMDAFEPGPLRAFERRRKESTASLHAAAARSMGWFETPPLSLAAIDRDAFAYSLVSRSGRIGRAEIASIDPAFLTRVDAGVLGAANNT